MAGPGHKVQFLESVRGIAALGVVCNHLVLMFYPWVLDPGSDALAAAGPVVRAVGLSAASVAIDGRTPVLVFFVLSGFVLALSQLRASADPAAAASSAAARRYVRLAGPILGSLAVAYAVYRVGGFPDRTAARPPDATGWISPGHPPAMTLLDPRDGALAQGIYGVLLGDPPYDGVLWTMPIELAGSYLVFAFVALFGRARHRWLAYAVAAAAFVLADRPFMVEFLLGAAVADAYLTVGPLRVAHRGELQWTVWPLLAVAAAFAAHRRIDLRGLDRLPWRPYHATVGAALFVALPLVSSPLRRLCDARPLVWLGRVSFGLYLTHGTVIASVGAGLYLHLRRSDHWSHPAATAAAAAASVVVSLSAGWAFYHAVDRPSVAAARRVADVVLGRRPQSRPT